MQEKTKAAKKRFDVRNRMVSLAAHTVLPGKGRQEFSSAIEPLEWGVDAVLSYYWRRKYDGLLGVGSCWALYRSEWDRDTNTLLVGGSERNTYAKDGLAPYRPYSVGVAFSTSERSNIDTFDEMDHKAALVVESDRLRRQLIEPGPPLGRCLLAFNSAPSYVETPALRTFAARLAFDLSNDRIPVPDFLRSPASGRITGLHSDQDGSCVIIDDDPNLSMELPPWVQLGPLCRQGSDISRGSPVGTFELDDFYDWDGLESQINSEAHRRWLLENVWRSRIVQHVFKDPATGVTVDYSLIDHDLVDLDQAQKAVRPFRDVRHLLGRVRHAVDQSVRVIGRNQAKITVWDTEGDPLRMCFSEDHTEMDLLHLQEQWSSKFEYVAAEVLPSETAESAAA